MIGKPHSNEEEIDNRLIEGTSPSPSPPPPFFFAACFRNVTYKLRFGAPHMRQIPTARCNFDISSRMGRDFKVKNLRVGGFVKKREVEK